MIDKLKKQYIELLEKYRDYKDNPYHPLKKEYDKDRLIMLKIVKRLDKLEKRG